MSNRGPAAVLLTGSALAALLGAVTLVVVARVVGPEVYAEFAVWWAVYFAATGAVLGLQSEVAARQLGRSADGQGRTVGARVVQLAVTAAPLATLLWLAHLVIEPVHSPVSGAASLVLAMVLSLGLVLMAEAMGFLVAQGGWRVLAGLIVLDALMRLLLVAVVLRFWPTSTAAFVVSIAASMVVFFPLWIRGVRRVGSAMPEGGAHLPWRAWTLMAAGVSFGILTVGTPGLVAALTALPPTQQASLYAGLVVLRAPLLMAATALQPLLLRLAVDSRDRGVAHLGHMAGLLGLVAAAVLAGAALLGGPVVGLIFGGEYEVSTRDVTAIVAGGLLLVGAQSSATVLVTRRRHGKILLGWIIGVLVTAIVLTVPVQPDLSVPMALVLGPLAALVVHGAALLGPPAVPSETRRLAPRSSS